MGLMPRHQNFQWQIMGLMQRHQSSKSQVNTSHAKASKLQVTSYGC
jgi:hypothetical protein